MGFHKSHGRKKNTSAAEGGRKILAFFFFFCENQDFSGKMTNFGAFWNFTDVRFATFSVLTDVSFGENEISTDVRFRALGGVKTGGGQTKKKNSRLSTFWGTPLPTIVKKKHTLQWHLINFLHE